MKKLLVPTDFSECSNYAVDLAFQIALNNDSEIHFMHVISVPVDWVKMTDDQTKLYADVNHKMHHVHGQLDGLLDRADKAGLKAFKFVGYNDSFNTVIDHINHHDIDLVIMGSRGAKGLEEFLVGSNSQKIIRMSKVPVLVVKSAMKDLTVKRCIPQRDRVCQGHWLQDQHGVYQYPLQFYRHGDDRKKNSEVRRS